MNVVPGGPPTGPCVGIRVVEDFLAHPQVEHTDEVLGEIGFGAAAIAALGGSGAIA